jgi:hypothetical protein
VSALKHLLLAALLAATPLAAQELLRDRKPEQRPALLVIGSGHFANPGRDVVNIQIEDVLTPQRQREIQAVVDRLAAFHPTHVAVEWPRDKQAEMDKRYGDYRAGKYALSRSERDQIGLRLAAKLNLPRVDAVDWNGMPPGDFRNYDFEAWGKAHGFAGRLAAITDPAKIPIGPFGDRSITDWLLQINRPETLATLHRMYFDFAAIGSAREQPGAAWVGTWYARNLRILNNLVTIASRPDDRVLVIYGAGHAYVLRQMGRESGAFRVMDAAPVLAPPLAALLTDPPRRGPLPRITNPGGIP